jgi:signal transduction histidine kinase/DNA-binding response OmpR family regulator
MNLTIPRRKQSETTYSVLTITALVLGIYYSGQYAYVLFHGLVETVSVAIAFAMFVLVWNTRAYMTNNYLWLLGIGYAFSAFIDLLHTFAFKGMTVFTGYGDNLAPQLWLSARYLQTATLVAAPLVIRRALDHRLVFAAYTAAVALLLWVVYSGHFPDCIVPGKGLTAFKKNSEYVISALLTGSLWLLSRNKSHFGDRIYRLIVASICCTIVSELCFTAFVSMYDFTNKLGHVAKLISFYLVYRAILVTGLKEPFAMVFRDLKRAEEELRAHSEELAVAKEQAERANRAKSIFLANMSHELRTPLNAVLGFSQVMRHDPNISPEQKDHLAIINRSGEYLLALINNVLDISKIEAGRVVLDESGFDLFQLAHEIKSLMYVRAHEKGLEFKLELLPDLPRHVVADGGKIRQLLLNLVGNAIKYTPHGWVALRIMAVADGNAKNDPSFPSGEGGRRPAERLRLRFEVEDTGPGIQPEDRERIFLPFVQLENRPLSEAGTGLGLAICKQYAELMGGTIAACGEPGAGSLFCIEIMATAQAAALPPQETRHGRAIALAEGEPRRRLLIAEDQPENLLLLRKLLEPFRFELKEAHNGEEAVALAGTWRPALIFMDIRMPVMDGIEATRRIKSSEAGAGIRIIAVTAHALDEDGRAIVAAGCDDFIRKPYRDVEIIDVLTKHLSVRFVYDDETVPPPQEARLDAAAMAALPEAERRELEQALVRLDIDGVNRAIATIRAHDPSLAEALATATADLQLGGILKLLREQGENKLP